MATSVFTTWQALYEKLLDDLASSVFVRRARKGTVDIEYGSQSELLDAIERVRVLAAQEAGTVYPRTYAKQGGRASS